MRKFKSYLLIVLALVMVSAAFMIAPGASSAYQTYTYSISGEALHSPDAYHPDKAVNASQIGIEKFNNPSDMVTDHEKKVYIANTDNNEIVVLDRYYAKDFVIKEFTNDKGNPDTLSKPQGVFVTEGGKPGNEDGEIWVCDTGHSRLVVFDRLSGKFKKIVDQPESQLIEENAIYEPIAMAIDQYGRIYVVSSSAHQGIIVMDPNGGFVGFIGAQVVSISAWDLLWRRFQTKEQRDATEELISSAFNNITITEEGFLYATSSMTDQESQVESAIRSKSKAGDYMPVKLLNPAGEEIMRRNGFWPPAGEIDYSTNKMDTYFGVSTITDAAVGPEQTWSIVDSKRQKIYTYDFNGNLLFAFGDKGDMLGSLSKVGALCYQGDTLLVLDKEADGGCIVVYERTPYGDMLIEAIAAENDLDYDHAIACWKEVLQRNTNFDAAYVGIGNALYRSGKYEESLEYFEIAYETANWSESYKEVRKEWMADWFILLAVIIVAVIVLVGKFFGYAAKVNKRVAVDGRARKTFKEELLYGFYVMFHPFDGYYDLKHEHRGSVRAALVFLGATILTFFYQGIGQGYVLNPTRSTTTIFTQILSVVVPVALFVLGNWCLTTLFEGEGSLKDIFVATGYALVPLPLLIIPATLVSNWVTATEASLVSLVVTIAFIWAIFLIVFGMMVTHDYPMFKNFITIIGTIVAMAFIIFIVLLFSMLLAKLVSFVTNIVTEIRFRL
jgi:tetratricopeptide (TPR) repeat protein